MFDVCPIPKGELLMREEPVLVLTRDSKMRGSEQLQDQFNRLHTDSQVSKMRGTEQLQDQFNRLHTDSKVSKMRGTEQLQD